MCDTMVALPPATASGSVLFAKNSDRERNEAQFLDLVPATRHEAGSALRCSYIEIPQVARTHAVLLSRPFWCWGAEMGANEHGVAIGNEAVFARLPANRTPALVGMDLLRLGLERSTSAAEAVDVMTGLLERHGQGGNCGHLHEHYYDNSFIVADAREAFVLETIGRMWAVERCPPIRAISNALSIGPGAIERSGGGLVEHAAAQGWCSGAADLDMANAYIDLDRDAVSQGRLRCDRSTTLMRRREGRLAAADMMANLRDHGAAAEGLADWHPDQATTRTICMHAGADGRRGQTVGSMVADLHPDRPGLYWMTGTSGPCTSIFKPVLIEGGLIAAGLPSQGPRPSDKADADSLWWRHERLHRAVVTGDHPALSRAIAAERDALEAGFAQRMADVIDREGAGAAAGRVRAVAECWAQAEAAEVRWMAAVPAAPARRADRAFAESWTELGRLAGLPASPPEKVLTRC